MVRHATDSCVARKKNATKMAVNVPLTCMHAFGSSVHVWGAYGDVSLLRSSPDCRFNSSAVQGAGLSLFFLGLGTFAPTAAAAVD